MICNIVFQSRGEVCTMAPLHLHEGMKDHPLYEQSLLALATLTKVHCDFLLRAWCLEILHHLDLYTSF